ncbi:integrase catalytic domain-containing protein [Trichonephila clavipes]|nr:integrase catalytic domain-containing protein [Trichonephila clavipes]
MNYHLKNVHVSAQTLLYLVRQEFWPLGGRNTARQIVQNCVVCFKNKPKNLEQIMGNLPRERITPSSPFTHVAIDFTGPFYIIYKGQRKGIYHKCYVAIFICFITKAIHIEVVTQLTIEAMIATLKRFFSRRGKSTLICTDNATNSIGASRELQRLYNLIKNPPDILANYLTIEEITWKFIPPRSPNFGGLWEGCVKSFKHHFKRTVGDARLTLEQFITITTQIEGILNSRPLTPMSSDPNDFAVLTPGHFLIGRPLQSLPEPDMTDNLDNRLSQWQKLTKFVQFIWRKWRLYYLNNLQARHKWQFEKESVTPNSMVILKDENLPPCKWTMGRILEIVKGSDGKVSVVKVKIPQGIFKRGISKICLLPNV